MPSAIADRTTSSKNRSLPWALGDADLALGDFGESDVGVSHARLHLHHRTAGRRELADTARDHVDEDLRIRNDFDCFFEVMNIHGQVPTRT